MGGQTVNRKSMIDRYAIFHTFESHKTVWAIANPTQPVSKRARICH